MSTPVFPERPTGTMGDLEVLSESDMYRDYERAFSLGTGLPLRLHEPELLKVVRYVRKQENPFCALMATTNQSCGACYALQQKLEHEAQLAPKTLKCFAGLCDTAVPVRVGNKLIALLQTGQVLLHRPNIEEFNKTAQTLVEWGAQVDLKKLEEAYFNTRVLSPQQYDALIRLLSVFAEHLAACSNSLVLAREPEEAPAIGRAKEFIHEHAYDSLSLRQVARVVNMSATYFSEKFKRATGINFVEYVARTRIEKARNLLENPNLRISEIAFEVGFQSLSQFNRTFKKFVGQSPSDFRADISKR